MNIGELADAALQGVRDAAAVVSGYQDAPENQQRLREFIGGDMGSKGTRSFAGAVSAAAVSGKRKFGRALGKLKKKRAEKKRVVRRGCTMRFGDGDGSYWDRWMSPAKSAKYALPSTGWASKTQLEPRSGFKRDQQAANMKRVEQSRELRSRENKIMISIMT